MLNGAFTMSSPSYRALLTNFSRSFVAFLSPRPTRKLPLDPLPLVLTFAAAVVENCLEEVGKLLFRWILCKSKGNNSCLRIGFVAAILPSSCTTLFINLSR